MLVTFTAKILKVLSFEFRYFGTPTTKKYNIFTHNIKNIAFPWNRIKSFPKCYNLMGLIINHIYLKVLYTKN